VSTPQSTDGKVEVQIEGLPLNVPVVVTEQIGAAAGATASTTGAPSAVIERQLRNILGWTPKPADTYGLVRALEKSFSAREDRGVTRWYYTPRGTAIPLEAAEITGAQGSLYLRAKGAVDDMLTILDGLEPMREEAADEDAVEGIRTIVQYTLSQIVDEIGRDGGPTVPLVDSLFDQLLGTDETKTKEDEVDGDVGRLRDRFYFDRDFISTLADETNFTKFLTLVDSAVSLRGSWIAQRDFFVGTSGKPFFGPQLSKLRRVLETIGQNAEEVFVALDTVGIDQTERESLVRDSLFLQPTLDWVQGYVTEAAPRLVEQAGVDGAKSLLPNLAAMADAVDKFIPPVDAFPTLYNTPLVFATLQSLQRGLVEAAKIVEQLGVGPGAHAITLKTEVVPPVTVPPPDDTEAPPIVVEVSKLAMAPKAYQYQAVISDHKSRDKYFLENPDTGDKYRGVLGGTAKQRTCTFDVGVVEKLPPMWKVMRVRSGETDTQVTTLPTSRASSAPAKV
jgi:hypothetical protein